MDNFKLAAALGVIIAGALAILFIVSMVLA